MKIRVLKLFKKKRKRIRNSRLLNFCVAVCNFFLEQNKQTKTLNMLYRLSYSTLKKRTAYLGTANKIKWLISIKVR